MTESYDTNYPQVKIRARTDRFGDPVVEVFHKEERIFVWNNLANVDYPEDLTWSREISEVFWAGVDLGRKLAEGD